MKLSELRKVLSKVKAIAREHGNDDPDISFWLSDDDIDFELKMTVPDDLDDARKICRLEHNDEPGNFSFQVHRVPYNN